MSKPRLHALPRDLTALDGRVWEAVKRLEKWLVQAHSRNDFRQVQKINGWIRGLERYGEKRGRLHVTNFSRFD